MKLPELKKKFNNKYVIRIIAGVLTIAMVGTGVSVYSAHSENPEQSVENVQLAAKDEADVNLADMLKDNISVSEKEIGKDETVYLISDATGNVTKTIVSDHLVNKDKATTLKDKSTLKDIENVKGDEEFTQSGDDVTWQADGSDIYYQGTSTEKTPVSMKVSYKLDGKDVTPEELAGKSGKVTIRYDYTNNSKFTETVNGEEVSVCVPFAAITGMVLDDSFTNVEVTNGKVQTSGNNNIVIGYALPGLKDSLDLKDSDLSGDVNVPEYFEVTADVENFSLETAMTVVANAGNFLSTDGSSDLSSVDDMINTLTDASSQLQNGSAELASGLDTLQGSLKEFSDGMNTLAGGLKTYTDGTKTLSGGIGQVKGGVDQLYAGKDTLAGGVTQLNDGAQALNAGVQQLDSILKAPMSDVQKNNVIAQVNETLASQVSEEEVSNQIYKALRYGENNSDGVLYSSLYNGNYASQYKANLKVSYDATVKQVLSIFANKKLGITDIEDADTADSIKGKIDNRLVQIASAYANDPVKYAGYAEAAKIYSATDGMSSSQMAEFLFANSEGDEDAGKTLYEKVENIVNETIALNDNLIEKGVGDSLHELADKLADNTVTIVSSVAQTAALSGAEGAMKEISSQINAKQANGESLISGAEKLATGTKGLAKELPTLTNGIITLKGGVDQLSAGANKLVANNDTLTSGAAKLVNGTSQVVDGVNKLDTGSHTLADGMVEFNETGINKLVNAYTGDLKPLASRLQAVLDAGEDYQSYTDVADGVNGSVKFVYKLGAIKVADAE